MSREGSGPGAWQWKGAIKRLHGLIPREVVPCNQEVTAVEAGQEFRAINDALFGV